MAVGESRGPERWFVPACAGLVGSVGMIAALGPRTVHPGNVDWLTHGDFGLHFFGWHLYRAGPWTLPIGAAPNLIWPVGSSVGLTDAIPIAAIAFKLFDQWLPPVFQFIGLWLVACFALQGVFGVLLMRLVTPRPVLQLLGAMLFILSPPLIFRIGHAALSAHWVLLAALWLSLRPDTGLPSLRRSAQWTVLAALTAAIQPYLLLMVVVLMLATFAHQVSIAPRRVLAIAAHAAMALFAAWVALWQSGSLMVPSGGGLAVGGFGDFSANLLTFVMPTEWRTLLAPGPLAYANPRQYEGYAYLGLGTLLVGAVVVIASAVSGEWRPSAATVRRHLALSSGVSLLALMAIGPVMTAGSTIVFEYDPRWWGPLTIFRSSGRMIWPLFYATVTAILFRAARLRYATAVALLSVAVAVQAVDLAGMRRFVGEVGFRGVRDSLNSPFWRVVPRHYERLILLPSNLCGRDGAVEIAPFLMIAGRDRLQINAGATARYDVQRAAAYCAALAEEVRAGAARPGSLYVISASVFPQVAPQAEASGATCIRVDGFGVCYAAESARLWREALQMTPELR